MAKEDAKIIIGGDAQRAVKSLQDVSKNLGGLGNSVSSFMGTATGFLNWQTAAIAGAGALASGFAKLMSDAIDTADQMANMSKRTGIAVESLSKLSYVAKMSDTSMETLQKSLKFLNTNLYDASKGNETAIKKFSEFGVAVLNADGTVKNAEQSLIAVADAYIKLDSEAAKTKLATELFGKAGQELMPMLSEGGAGIKALTDEAERMGVVVSSQTAAAAEEFNDKLDKMKTFAQGVALQVLEDLVPSINELNVEMDEFNKTGSAVSDTASVISGALDFIAFAANNLSFPLRTLLGLLDGFEQKEATLEKFTGKYAMKDFLMSGHTPTTAKSSMVPQVSGKGGKSKNKNEPDGVYRESFGDSGMSLADRWITDLTAASGNIDFVKGLNSTINFNEFDLLKIPGLDVNLLRDRQQPLIDQWAEYYQQIQDLGTTNFVIMSQTTQDVFNGIGEALTGFGNLLSTTEGKTEQDYRAMFEIGKAFKSAEIITSTYSAAVKAYDSQVGIPLIGPALAVAAAGAAVAFGTAQLANLWATQPGQTSVSGGGVAPVPNFAQRNPQGGNGGGTKNIVIKFEGFIWDKDRLAREIIPALNRAISDGVGR